MEEKYTIAQKGERVYVCKNGKRLHTPKGNLVYTDNETLSQQLADALNAGEEYSDNASLLCYHFSYCDLVTEFTSEDIANDIATYCREAMIHDEYLLFRQGVDGAVPVSKRYIDTIIHRLPEYTMHQLVAILVIINSTNSLALAFRMIEDVVGKDEDAKASFLADLMEFEIDNFGDDMENDAEQDEVKRQMKDMVETFVKYWNR